MAAVLVPQRCPVFASEYIFSGLTFDAPGMVAIYSKFIQSGRELSTSGGGNNIRKV